MQPASVAVGSQLLLAAQNPTGLVDQDDSLHRRAI
jgi:hypothetical protein